jgi:hypothetical protein
VKQIGKRLRLSPRTVETHLSRLYRKLGARNRVQALSRAAALGFVDLGPGVSHGETRVSVSPPAGR